MKHTPKHVSSSPATGRPPRRTATAAGRAAAPRPPASPPPKEAASAGSAADIRHASAGEGIRLNKRMAELGLCSRREADDWIARQWVYVNGEPAQMGQRVGLDDHISVQQAARHQQAAQVTIVLHKPVGYVSAQPEDGYPGAASLVQARTRWSGDTLPLRFQPRHARGLAPAGRLDIDSTGLLILTQDGRLARHIIGEHSTVEKEYLVRVQYQPHAAAAPVVQRVQDVFTPHKLQLLRHGLSLDGQALLPAQVEWQNPEQLRFVLRQGKKRQIRRMCEAVGLQVTGLKRIRIGRILLGRLPPGQWRYLADELV